MIYLFVALFFFTGVGFHVMEKIGDLRKKFPTFRPREVFGTFAIEEWNTVVVAGLVLGLIELLLLFNNYYHLIVKMPSLDINGWHCPDWIVWLIPVAIDVTLGYQSQRIIYKYLGTATQAIEKKADDIAKKLD